MGTGDYMQVTQFYIFLRNLLNATSQSGIHCLFYDVLTPPICMLAQITAAEEPLGSLLLDWPVVRRLAKLASTPEEGAVHSASRGWPLLDALLRFHKVGDVSKLIRANGIERNDEGSPAGTLTRWTSVRFTPTGRRFGYQGFSHEVPMLQWLWCPSRCWRGPPWSWPCSSGTAGTRTRVHDS